MTEADQVHLSERTRALAQNIVDLSFLVGADNIKAVTYTAEDLRGKAQRLLDLAEHLLREEQKS